MSQTKKMTRVIWKQYVFRRDRNRCVVPDCRERAADAHHILSRKLFKDGGYHLDNGVSLCGRHHTDAETLVISAQDLRKWAGITEAYLPPQLDPNKEWNCWGYEC